MLIEIICRLSKKRSPKINKLKDERKCAFIERSLKSKRRYWLLVKFKVIKYKKNFSLLYIFPLLLLS